MFYHPRSAAPALPLAVRRVLPGLLVLTLLAIAGCAGSVTIDPPGVDHPANPNAAAAPTMPLPATLSAEPVPRPEPIQDPHAGHQGHQMR
jgi:hypothetical protein